MKKFFLLAITIVSAQLVFAQTEISRDASGNKIIKGFLSKETLATDTAFAWYGNNQKSYTPNADVIKNYSAGKDAVNIVVFGGTWCGDTKQILPGFFKTVDAASFPESRITLIGVDRNKKTLYNLSEAFGITNVPTFIVMKDGK